MRLRRAAVAAAATAVAVTATIAVRSEAGPALPATLGACPMDDAFGPAALTYLSRPGAWVRVAAIDPRGRDGAYGGRFEVAGGDAPFVAAIASAPSPLRMTDETATAIARALRAGAAVHVHTAGPGGPREVAFALALTDREYAFLGPCAYPLLTEPLHAAFGDATLPTLAGVVGKPSAGVRAALLPQRPAQPAPVPVLHPGDAPAATLARLRHATFALRVPATWHGANTVCTKIAAGWNDCVDLRSPELAAIPVGLYYDPAAPAVEVWLLDVDAHLSRPIVRLGTVTVRDPDAVGVTLAATPSLADVLADHALASRAIARSS